MDEEFFIDGDTTITFPEPTLIFWFMSDYCQFSIVCKKTLLNRFRWWILQKVFGIGYKWLK